jgi:predicted dinucleotide-binding enzyme
MRIGVIGSGNVGSGLAGFWERAGHEVRVSTRETVGETAAFGEVVVLAVPAAASESVLSAAGPLEGKVLVDATNAVRGGSTAVDIVRLAPGARIVKAFNTLFALAYDRISAAEPPASLVYCGDDAEAKETIAQLIRDVGLEPVDAGGLDVAPQVEAFAQLIIGIAYAQGRGPFLYRFEIS